MAVIAALSAPAARTPGCIRCPQNARFARCMLRDSRKIACAAKRKPARESEEPANVEVVPQPATLLSSAARRPPTALLTTLFAAGMGGIMGLLPDLQGPVSTLQAIGILCGIVAFHELGHFTAARLQGIHVSKFAIGFGPKLWGYKAGEVEYSLRAFPLGGFVAFPDNDEDCPYPDDDPDLLKNRPIWDRFWVISAGMCSQTDANQCALRCRIGRASGVRGHEEYCACARTPLRSCVNMQLLLRSRVKKRGPQITLMQSSCAGVIFNVILAFMVTVAQVQDIGYMHTTYNPGVRLPIVMKGGAAERYGLLPGDVILALDDKTVPTGAFAPVIVAAPAATAADWKN
jgi:Peptidase family M50